MGLTEPPPDASTQDTLREALTQALSSTTFKEVTHGVLLRVVKLELTDDEVAAAVAGCTFEAGGLAAPAARVVRRRARPVALPRPERPMPRRRPRRAHRASCRAVRPRSHRRHPRHRSAPHRQIRPNRAALEDVGADGPRLVDRSGTVGGRPGQVLVSNRVVARGEVVIVGGNYGGADSRRGEPERTNPFDGGMTWNSSGCSILKCSS